MSLPWQVYKFGGSSVGTPGRLPKVIELIAAAPKPLALVVSAPGDSTDWLILAARSAADGNISQARRELAQVRELAAIIARTVLNSQSQKGLRHDLDEILTPVERLLSGVELTRECSPRTLDSIISVGERISIALLARALNERGVPAIPVDAREFIVTDATYGAATVDKPPRSLPRWPKPGPARCRSSPASSAAPGTARTPRSAAMVPTTPPPSSPACSRPAR
jgi:bifunctional aspartokinase / homoserine dehydrogenase 1